MTADEITNARRALGLSINQMANLCDVDLRTVRRWEDGTREPTATAARFIECCRKGYIRAEIVSRLAGGRLP